MPKPAPSAPPRQRLGEDQRRAQITAATIEELADRGYADASLTRIAERAGVSKGLVWHYFAGKDDLMEATARATLASLRDVVAARLDLSQPVPDVLRAALRIAASLSSTHPRQMIALSRIVHNLRHADGSPRLTLDAYEETYLAQESLFHRGQAEGTLRDFDTRVLAVTYQGAIDAMLGYLEANPDADPEHYAGQLAEILLVGIQCGTAR